MNYQLKITLQDSSPEIWRRIIVPATITLDRLHDVIQIVMGWMDSHLYEFKIGKKRYLGELDDFVDEENSLLTEDFRLNDLIKKTGRTFQYIYDYGDDWIHDIVLEKTISDDINIEQPVYCTGGENACPPEDVGGIDGYKVF